MKSLRISSCIVFLILLVFSCEKRICGCDFPPSPLLGDWRLNTITYGLTQKTVTAAEAGYSESLVYDGIMNSGTYQQTRNGLPIKSGSYTLSFPNGGGTEGIIYYKQDSTEQSFRLADSKLYLTERIPQGATIADGSTYEYKRQ